MEQTKAAENLSQWFNLAEQKPWGPGVYEVKHKSGRLGSAFWDCEKFKNTSVIRELCSEQEEREHAYKLRRINPESWEMNIVWWRGLASDPSAKPKARGNRRVTRYVVMDDIERKPVASFATKKAAENYEESMMVFSSIEKIRFRTPEAD